MKLKSALPVLAGGLLVASMPLLAHHSFMAEFDQKQKISMEGVVTEVKWQNPHTYFSVDVKEKNGKIVNWTLETGSPNALIMRGWQRDTMKPGDHISIRGYSGQSWHEPCGGPIGDSRGRPYSVWGPDG